MIKQGQFIEVEYVGNVKGSDIVFDRSLGPNSEKTVIVCLGKGMLLKGLEDKLIGKEVSKEYEIDLGFEEAFGKKDPKLIKIMQVKMFLEKKINPVPGLQVDIDGVIATIRSVSGGRCVVDFNHPLAGRNLTYKIKVSRIVNDIKEKIDGVMKLEFPFFSNYRFEEGKLIVTYPKADHKLKQLFEKRIKELIPEVKDIGFEDEKKPKSENN